jgi:SAM-dependent methyltransferase
MAFFQADVAKPPEEFEGYFDAIFCCLSFHHYPDGEAAVRAFRKVLAPGGKVFVADAGPRWFVELARPISELADPGFVRHRTGEEFLRMFTEAGFSSVSWVEALPGIGVTVASM